jgi:SAM-dependent methyltransferase
VCAACGAVQKLLNPEWFRSISDIYGAYSIYNQSGGVEQSVFDQRSGSSLSRSAQLLTNLIRDCGLPETGRLLDVGCGNGGFLKAFGSVRKNWSLAGSELDSRNQNIIESLPGVERLYTCDVKMIPGEFDAISLIHVLEHILNPLVLLQKLHHKLREGGLFLIQVPNYQENPFDLVIADHCTHFSNTSLVSLIEAASFEVETVKANWIPKELSLAARKGRKSTVPPLNQGSDSMDSVRLRLSWLSRVKQTASEIAQKGTFGIFGTAIAGSWLCSLMEHRVEFFVDEDANRIGRIHMGKPIHSPASVPAKSHVFLALPPEIAAGIAQRLQALNHNFDLYLPPLL